jgi:hypothetical protein
MTCSLSAPSTITTSTSGPVSGAFAISSSVSGLTGYWYGTKDGATDVSGVSAGPVPTTATFTFDTTQAGSTYNRYAVIKDYTGAVACTTNTTSTQILPPPTTCALTAPSSVQTSYTGAVSATFNLTTSGTGLTAYWNGSTNGVTDTPNFLTTAAPYSLPVAYAPNMAGSYTRYAVLKNSSGATVCTTNSVSVQVQAPPAMTCSLSSPSTITTSNSGPVSGAFSISSSVPNLTGYWYGTRNGATDMSGVSAGPVPTTATFTFDTSQAGYTYNRYVVIKDYTGAVACTTNTTSTQILAPPTTCSMSGPSTVQTSNSGAVSATFSIATNGTGLTAYWNGSTNGVQDSPNFLVTSAPGSVPVSYTPSMAANYTRYAILKNSAGLTMCTTNIVSTQVLAPPPLTCSLSVTSSNVYPTAGNPAPVTFSWSANQTGLTAYWYGTNNGVTDASGGYAGPVPNSYGFAYDTSFSGHTFVRYLMFYNGSTPVCTTNSVSVTIH